MWFKIMRAWLVVVQTMQDSLDAASVLLLSTGSGMLLEWITTPPW
jgi:hypothetical protein